MLHLNLNFILVGIQGKWSRKASGTHSEGKNVNYFSRLVSVLSTIFQESLKNNQKFRSYRSILRFSVRVRVVLPSSFVVSNELRSKNPIEIDDFREVSNASLPSPPLPSPSSHLESYSADGTNPRITLFYLCYENQPFTLTSVCIFSLLFYLHFLLNLRGKFVYQSRASWVGDHFLYSHDLNVWSRGDIVGEIRCVSLLRVIFYPGPFHP